MLLESFEPVHALCTMNVQRGRAMRAIGSLVGTFGWDPWQAAEGGALTGCAVHDMDPVGRHMACGLLPPAVKGGQQAGGAAALSAALRTSMVSAPQKGACSGRDALHPLQRRP